MRSTTPATGVVIDASIFMASMLATASPAATLSPARTITVTTTPNGAATCPRVFLTRTQTVEKVDGRQHRDVAVLSPRLQEVAGRPDEEQVIERRPPVGREPLPIGLGQLGGRWFDLASGQCLGAERLGPSSGRVAEFA
jgi:hypothetical protein